MKGLKKKQYLDFALEKVLEFGHTVESITGIWTGLQVIVGITAVPTVRL